VGSSTAVSLVMQGIINERRPAENAQRAALRETQSPLTPAIFERIVTATPCKPLANIMMLAAAAVGLYGMLRPVELLGSPQHRDRALQLDDVVFYLDEHESRVGRIAPLPHAPDVMAGAIPHHFTLRLGAIGTAPLFRILWQLSRLSKHCGAGSICAARFAPPLVTPLSSSIPAPGLLWPRRLSSSVCSIGAASPAVAILLSRVAACVAVALLLSCRAGLLSPTSRRLAAGPPLRCPPSTLAPMPSVSASSPSPRRWLPRHWGLGVSLRCAWRRARWWIHAPRKRRAIPSYNSDSLNFPSLSPAIVDVYC